MALVTHVGTPYKSLADVVAAAKQKPGAIGYGSIGSGSLGHLAMTLAQTQGGFRITHVPYKGWGDCVLGLMRGEVDLMFDNVSTALPNITAGKFRPLAIAAATRHRTLPDTPTLDEQLLDRGAPGITFTRRQRVEYSDEVRLVSGTDKARYGRLRRA